ncbi:MAG TPA: LCP family protein [Candidatus Faecousia intestinigallinarum]|nr:LCP family protein [Candidatus Faecousia intestinigallinarum]
MKEKKTAKSSGRGKRTALIVLCVILAMLLAVLIFATVYLETIFGRLGRTDDLETLSPDELASALEWETVPEDFSGPIDVEIEQPTGPADKLNAENITNILLIGRDSGRSDAMILASFNKSNKTLTLTSFLRDMYVYIPDRGNDKLNHSYAYGGVELLNDTIAYNFGIEIDGNVVVGFDSFEDVIDAIGGVDVELTWEEIDHLGGQGISLSQDSNGLTHLDGRAALAYSRIRYLDSDFGRTNRQRNVLEAILNKAKSMSIAEMNDMLMELLPIVSTDLSDAEIIGYALELFPMLLDCKVVSQQIPADGTWYNASQGGMAVLIVDFEENRKILHDTLGG